MQFQEVIDYCLAKPAATSDFPFDEEVLAVRVMGKIFALSNMKEQGRINLKCIPEFAEVLRSQFPEHVKPGYHMNKRHWNTVTIDDTIKRADMQSWIDLSYDLIVESLTKAKQAELARLNA